VRSKGPTLTWVGVDDAHFNGDCYRSAAVDSLDEHVSATHLGIDAETLHDETVFARPAEHESEARSYPPPSPG